MSRGLFVLTEQGTILLSSHPEFVCTVVDTLYSVQSTTLFICTYVLIRLSFNGFVWGLVIGTPVNFYKII